MSKLLTIVVFVLALIFIILVATRFVKLYGLRLNDAGPADEPRGENEQYDASVSGGGDDGNVSGGGGGDRRKDLAKNPRTKSEAAAIAAIEGIIGAKMPTVNPKWLAWRGRKLELDGYSAEKKVALEFSGPLHTKWYPDRESYEVYFERIVRDVVKRRLCKKKGVTLIVIDMTLPPQHHRDYIKSRLFDAGRYDLLGHDTQPVPYINEQTAEPFRNETLERDLGLEAVFRRASSL